MKIFGTRRDRLRSDGIAIYDRLFQLALPYKWIFFIAVLAMIVNSAVDVRLAHLMKELMDEGFHQRGYDQALYYAGLIVVIFFLRGVSSYTYTYCISWIGRRVVSNIRQDMFNHLVLLPTSFYDRSSSGDLLSRLTYNTEQVAGAATKAITVLVADSIRVIMLVGYMFYISLYLSLGLLVIAPAVAILVTVITKRLRFLSSNIQDSMGKVTGVAEEAITGHLVVKACGGHEHEKRQYKKAVEYNRTQSMKLVAADVLNVPVIQFVISLVLSVGVYVVVADIMPEPVTTGDFVAYLVAMSVLLPSIKRLTAVNAVLQRGIAAGKSIFDFLDEAPEPDEGVIKPDHVTGCIEYQNVHFRYSDEKGAVLRDISIRIEPGSMAAFVGRSGSGKSTLVNLLPRFYETTGGQITLDGYPIHDIERRSLREQIAYVGQNVTLFNDTIERNIAYGRLECLNTHVVIEAAKRACAWEFIEKLPQGLNTLVGENGVLLSGGQRQRLAIARALLQDAPVLILDEATSALDTESEKYIQAGLETLMKDRTTLVIAHRLSTVEKADMIFVMNEGRVVESGKHADLLAHEGLYAALYRMQFAAD